MGALGVRDLWMGLWGTEGFTWVGLAVMFDGGSFRGRVLVGLGLGWQAFTPGGWEYERSGTRGRGAEVSSGHV